MTVSGRRRVSWPKPAPRQEQLALLKRARKGDQQARTALVEMNMPLVMREAARMSRKGHNFEDLVQSGAEGLCRAVDKWNPRAGKKNTFLTYAVFWVRQRMYAEANYNAGTIQIPHRVFYALQGREASGQRVSDESLKTARAAMDPANLDDVMLKHLPSLTPDPDDKIYEEQRLAHLRRILAGLDARSQQILELRYGLNGHGGREHTLREIGDLIGLSRERIRQLLVMAMDQCKKRGQR